VQIESNLEKIILVKFTIVHFVKNFRLFQDKILDLILYTFKTVCFVQVFIFFQNRAEKDPDPK